MNKKTNYIFGPVPSRRLGYSLGLDIIPMKSCTQNCVYCQLGLDAPTTETLSSFVDIDDVLTELEKKLKSCDKIDYITLSGSGEPTLHSKLGELIERIKSICDIPVAVITNGTLLWNKKVAAALAKADIILPSLDAGDEKTFEDINRPNSNISFDKFVQGMIDFSDSYSGEIWLEIFLIKDRNTSEEQIQKMISIIDKIKPDKIQLNTAVRPTVEDGVEMVALSELEKIAEKISRGAEVIADFSKKGLTSSGGDTANNILEMIKRHPCCVDDIVATLGIDIEEAKSITKKLCAENKLVGKKRDNATFFSIPVDNLK